MIFLFTRDNSSFVSSKTGQLGVTQKDIAEALNVSRACVAIALNPNSKSRGRLLPETIARIEAKAQELNYRPQRLARILRSGRSYAIGVICQSGIYHGPQERVRHLARHAIQSGYQVVSVDIDWFDRDLSAAQDYLLGMAVEGVIFCNIAEEIQQAWRQLMHARNLPFVSMNGVSDTIDQTRVDMRTAFREMTLHHLQQGSRHLHLLLPFYDRPANGKSATLTPNQSARILGFADAIHSVGGHLVGEPRLTRTLQPSSGAASGITGTIHHPQREPLHHDVVDLGYYQTLHLFRKSQCPPDSLVCSNDHIAAGAIAACGELKVSIPDQVRISGSDNAPVSRYRGVQLTTINQPAEPMAEWSIRRVVELIENPQERTTPKQVFFPCELIFRSSTLALPTS